MKRKSVFASGALIVAAALIAVSCASAPPPAAAPVAQADPVSEFIREVRRGAPENALLGIGTSTHSNRGLARTTAETRARAEVARQVEVVVRNMVEDFTAGSEAEQGALLQFTTNVTQTLTQQAQSGAIIRDETFINGEQITVVMFTRDAMNNGLMNAHQASQALAPHANAAMWAVDRMDRALGAEISLEPTIRNHD